MEKFEIIVFRISVKTFLWQSYYRLFAIKCIKILTLTYLSDSFDIKVNSCTAIKFECIRIGMVSKNLTNSNLLWKFLWLIVRRIVPPLFLNFLFLIALSCLIVIKTAWKQKLKIVNQLKNMTLFSNNLRISEGDSTFVSPSSCIAQKL